MSLGLSPRVLASFDEDDDDDVIVLGMPWQRGHTLAIFSALCLSQRSRGSLGALTQLCISPTPAPHPHSSSLLISSSFSSASVILTPALALR